MIPLKNYSDVSSLVSNSLQSKGVEELDKMGLDLRNMSPQSKEAKIKRVAIQFEQMLINTLLKDAFKENNEDKGEMALSFGPGNDLRLMLWSQHIADNGGLGYQEVIEQQIKDVYLGQDNDSTNKGVTQDLQSLPIKQAAPKLPSRSSSTQNSRDISPNTGTTGLTEPLEVVKPVNGNISSNFGWRKDPIDGTTRFHNGIDIEVPSNTPIKSFMQGEVTFSGWKKGYGYMVEVSHPNGYTSRYGHNSKVMVKEGDKVDTNTTIALSGSTGRSTGPHLHFEIRNGETALDPSRILKNKSLSPNILYAKNTNHNDHQHND
jgi:murein DD-endopeptidase MepM/ murein hydrolase activator NlpD